MRLGDCIWVTEGEKIFRQPTALSDRCLNMIFIVNSILTGFPSPVQC